MEEQIKDIVFDTNYSDSIPGGWWPNVDFSQIQNNTKQEKKWFIDKLIESIFPQTKKVEQKDSSKWENIQWDKKIENTKKDQEKSEKKWFLDELIDSIIPQASWSKSTWWTKVEPENELLKDLSLKEQVIRLSEMILSMRQ